MGTKTSKPETRDYRHLLEKIILNPWDWNIICSLFPPDKPAVTSRRHWEWSRRNTDSHPQQEILICLHGKCLYRLKDRLYSCTPGTIMLFDSFEEHDCYYPPFATGVDHIWLTHVQGNIFARTFQLKNGKVVPAKSKTCVINDTDLESLLTRSWSDLKSSTEYSAAYRRLKLITAVLNILLSLYESDFNSNLTVDKEERQLKVIETMKRHIHESAGRGLTLDNLAQAAGYSKFHFLRLFQKYTGQSVHDYLNLCRIQRAVEMQKKGHLKKEIAVALGFSCLPVFSRWYKQMGKRFNFNKIDRTRNSQ